MILTVAAGCSGCALLRGRHQAQSRARLWRLLLADDPLDLPVTRPAQRFGVKGCGPRQQLIQEHAQRVDVAPRVDIKAAHLSLLRAHVLRRPDELTVLGEQRLLGEPGVRRLGDPEVDDLRHRQSIVEGHHDVGWLDVAMDDAFLVRVLHRATHLNEEPEPLAR